MVRLIIKNKEKNKYLLKDENNNSYILNLQFFDIEKEPKRNDYINISAELLNKQYREYTEYLSFGSLKNFCGREKISLNDIYVIKIEIEGKAIYLKRLYG